MVEAGAGLVVGTSSADGAPRATRAWSFEVVDAATQRIRFVMSADDHVCVEHLTSGAGTALTGADVQTFRSIQYKGRVVTVEPVNPHDAQLMAAQTDAFFEAVHRSDGNPIEQLRRMLPLETLAVEMVVDEMYDQSPGPDAGARLARTAP